MAIDIGIDCNDCFGDMLLSDPPVGLDFNDQGVQEAFCGDCGGGFEQEVLEFEKTIQSTFVNAFSNRKLGDLIHVLCIRADIHHLKYHEKQAEIQDIRDTCDSKKSLIDCLSKKYNENENFLEQRISLF